MMEITERGQSSWLCYMGQRIFSNMVEEEENKVYVRGKWIDFSKEKINGCSI